MRRLLGGVADEQNPLFISVPQRDVVVNLQRQDGRTRKIAFGISGCRVRNIRVLALGILALVALPNLEDDALK